MSLHRIPYIIGIACVLLCASAQNPVHIKTQLNQLLTSSTLTWIPHMQYYNQKIPRDIVIGGFEIIEHAVNNDTTKTITRESPIYVCRVQHEGTWVTGSQKQNERKCTVGFFGSLRSYDRYDLLENVDSAGRLSWTTWDRFTLQPNGMVAVNEGKLFVARHSAAKSHSDESEVRYITHCIGAFSAEEGFGKIFCAKDGKVQEMSKGEILVETEPVRYDLTNVKMNMNKQRVNKFEPQILGEATIQNPGHDTAKMAEAFPYSYNYSIYWGQVRAMSKGLNTTITLQNGTQCGNVKWGTADHGNKTIIHTVNVELYPGTGVNVTLKGNYTEVEVFYTADVVSHYEDGRKKSRSINGFRQEKSMTNVTVEYSPIYFLNNLSIVPTTEPPTTTTEAPTTTTVLPTTTTKRVPQPPILMSGVDEKVTKEDGVDENLIMTPKKTDLNMATGDGGPLSLKEAERSAASQLIPSLILLLIIVNKIT